MTNQNFVSIALALQINNCHLDLLKENKQAFMRRTGAERLVQGKFYQEGAELIFESKIINPIDNEVLFGLPIIRGAKEKTSKIV